MTDESGSEPSPTVVFEVYGTRVTIRVPGSDVVPQVVAQLPPHATVCDAGPDDREFALVRDESGAYGVVEDGELQERDLALEPALGVLRRRLFFHATEHARDRLVVSAGVVAHDGRAIVLPGASGAGKTRLVAALIQAGAVYYADDWAVLDPEGLVHPFPTTLFLKNEGRVPVEELGGVRGEQPIAVGLLATILYRPGASWSVRSLTAGEGALVLIRNAYGMDAPAVAMQIARRVTSRATVLEGERGDAPDAARALLELASGARSQSSSAG